MRACMNACMFFLRFESWFLDDNVNKTHRTQHKKISFIWKEKKKRWFININKSKIYVVVKSMSSSYLIRPKFTTNQRFLFCFRFPITNNDHQDNIKKYTEREKKHWFWLDFFLLSRWFCSQCRFRFVFFCVIYMWYYIMNTGIIRFAKIIDTHI